MATVIDNLTAEQTADLLVTLLAGAAGGTKARWRKLVAIEELPTWRFVRFNWRVVPTGTAAEREAIVKAVEIVRTEHPYLA